jgi:hypothetical protein
VVDSTDRKNVKIVKEELEKMLRHEVPHPHSHSHTSMQRERDVFVLTCCSCLSLFVQPKSWSLPTSKT